MEKNVAIELSRYLFMVVLISWHGGFDFFNHGYLVVEFFFVLSGFLMYLSYKKCNRGVYSYSVNRLKRTYLSYMLACVATAVIVIIPNINGGNGVSIEGWLKLLPELMLLQNVGVFPGGYNIPMWYYSVLVWGGAIVYASISTWKPLEKTLLPLFIVVYYTWHFTANESFERWDKVVVYTPFFRGLADLGLGVLTALAYLKLKTNVNWKNVFKPLTFVSFFLLILLMYGIGDFDKYCILLVPMFILGSFLSPYYQSDSIMSRLIVKLGGVSWSIFVIHYPLSLILFRIYDKQDTLPMEACRFAIYVLIITMASFCFDFICNRLNRFLFQQ